MENPLENLLEIRDRTAGQMQAKVHIPKGQELQVFELLEQRGVITWVAAKEVYSDVEGECLNGMFGVLKRGKYTNKGLPVLRVIMNLVPANRLLEVIHGDVALLPHGAAWIPLIVHGGEELRVSQADMASAFYLFSIPQAWYKFMCFNFAADGATLGKTPGVLFRPACRVLPMGWNSSVGIMQQLSRELLLSKGVPSNLELHKGRPAPAWFVKSVQGASANRTFWQVYLDNFMAAEHVDGAYHQGDIKLQELAMRAWRSAGVLTAEDKQVLGAETAVELGVRLYGTAGLLGPLRNESSRQHWRLSGSSSFMEGP